MKGCTQEFYDEVLEAVQKVLCTDELIDLLNACYLKSDGDKKINRLLEEIKKLCEKDTPPPATVVYALFKAMITLHTAMMIMSSSKKDLEKFIAETKQEIVINDSQNKFRWNGMYQ